jgi:hypothetical protein
MTTVDDRAQTNFARRLTDALVLIGFGGATGYLVYVLGWSFGMETRLEAAAATAVFAVGFVALGLAQTRWRANATLTWCSLALAAAAGDQIQLYVRDNQLGVARSYTFEPAPEIDAAIAAADWRNASDVKRELEARVGKFSRGRAVYILPPWVDLGYTGGIMPLGGSSNLPTFSCNEGGFWPIEKTDRYGFNNDDTIWDRKERRILLIGDSYAAGACVHQKGSVAGHLLQMGYAAASLGVGGNGPLIELASFREYARSFHPEVVVWFYFDFYMLNRLAINKLDSGWGGEAHSHSLMRYLDPAYSQGLSHRQVEVDALWDRLADKHDEYASRFGADPNAEAMRRTKLNDVRRQLGYRPLGMNEQISVDDAMDLFIDILKLAKAETESWGGKLLFAVYSDIQRFRTDTKSNRGEFLPRVQALGIPVVDIDQTILATGDPLAHFPFRGRPTPMNAGGWGHFNEAGYRVFAEAVAKAIAEP